MKFCGRSKNPRILTFLHAFWPTVALKRSKCCKILRGDPGLERRNLHNISKYFKNCKSYESIQNFFSCVIIDKNLRKFFFIAN